MKNDLERDLGLYATVTISMGAMIGSGIFVLPALGLKKAGPAVILAYILAGLVVLPAALSKAEMATAMPESGGTYLYIDRAMGPLAGTIAGIGAWFSLVFKSSFALVGLGAYLLSTHCCTQYCRHRTKWQSSIDYCHCCCVCACRICSQLRIYH
jgi:APA family basic amino acid/polyamine antiporter